MDVAIVIPARFKSSRFPGKPLAKIKGKPMVIRVADICSKVIENHKIFVATDSKVISSVVEKYNYNVIFTNKNNLTGTDRVAEAAKKIDAKIIVNVQGDEPLLNYKDIIKVINEKKKNFNQVINAYCPLSSHEKENNINIPKLVINEKNELIYMSRKAIPGIKDISKKTTFLKQVCIYAFNKSELKKFKNYGRKSKTEKFEDIEILRFFDLDIKIKMVRVNKSSQAVDTPGDLKLVNKLYK